MAMTDLDFETQKQRVLDLAYWWEPKLALAEWQIMHHFHRDASDMPDGGEALAVCRSHWKYKLANIHWDLQEMPDDDEMLERAFVHELMHIHLSETREDKGRAGHEERVATELALSFVFLKRELLAKEEAEP